MEAEGQRLQVCLSVAGRPDGGATKDAEFRYTSLTHPTECSRQQHRHGFMQMHVCVCIPTVQEHPGPADEKAQPLTGDETGDMD